MNKPVLEQLKRDYDLIVFNKYMATVTYDKEVKEYDKQMNAIEEQIDKIEMGEG